MFSLKYKPSHVLVLPALILGTLFTMLLLNTPYARAAIQVDCPDGYVVNLPQPSEQEINERCADHQTGGPSRDSLESSTPTESVSTVSTSGGDRKCRDDTLTADNCWIVYYIVGFTRILSGLVGIVIVVMIAIGGIQYAAAGPDPSAVVAARKRIINALIALVLYIFMFAFLQWLVPGGIF